MAAFASEAAWFGVPAVVGGYYSAVIGNEVADEFVPPSRYVLPEDLESAVESLIADAVGRRELGERARQFVRTRWSRTEVASRYARIICNDIPREWWFDPGRMTYLYGCGLSRDQAVARISAIIEEYGPDALGLGNKRPFWNNFRQSSSANYTPRPAALKAPEQTEGKEEGLHGQRRAPRPSVLLPALPSTMRGPDGRIRHTPRTSPPRIAGLSSTSNLKTSLRQTWLEYLSLEDVHRDLEEAGIEQIPGNPCTLSDSARPRDRFGSSWPPGC